MSYSENEKIRAAAWKTSTTTFPAEAKAPAAYVNKDGHAPGRLYDFCIPVDHAALNLLPEVRDEALRLFAELEIPWHAGTPAGPSNHLLSSQVQCANALTQMVRDPARIIRAFGELLDIDEVLEIEPGRFLTFEYIGPKDYFGEAPKGPRMRGAHCTSVDAAFLHRAKDGATELVLVEWKYTESYRVRRADPARDAIRFTRYGAALADPAGPVRDDLLSFEHLVDEPFYQLMRQQLLAHALEQDGVADRVRVVHVLSPDNVEYQQSLARPEHHALGGLVSQIWSQLLRQPDRFTSVDSKVFLDPEISSREYCLRYAGDVIHDVAGLLTAFEIERPEDLEDALYGSYSWDYDVEVSDEGVVLRIETIGTPLEFPFLESELFELCRELEAEVEGEGD